MNEVAKTLAEERGNVWCIVHQNIIRYIPLDIYTYVDINTFSLGI